MYFDSCELCNTESNPIPSIFKGPQPCLIFSNQVDIRKLEAQSSDKINTYVVNDLQNAIAIDYLFEQELIFWTDITLHTIKQAFMNGTNIKDVVKFGLDIPSK